MNTAVYDPDWQREAQSAQLRANEQGNGPLVGYAICRARTLIEHRTPDQVENLFRQKMEAIQ